MFNRKPRASEVLQVKQAVSTLEKSSVTIYKALRDSLKAEYVHWHAKDCSSPDALIHKRKKDLRKAVARLRELTSKSDLLTEQLREMRRTATMRSEDGESRTNDRHKEFQRSNATLQDPGDSPTVRMGLFTLSKSGLSYIAPLSSISEIRLAYYSAQDARLEIYDVLTLLCTGISNRNDSTDESTQDDESRFHNLEVWSKLREGAAMRRQSEMVVKRRMNAYTSSNTDTICNIPVKRIKRLRLIMPQLEESLQRGREIICWESHCRGEQK